MGHSSDPGDDVIRALLASRPLIALVGASNKPTRPSHDVMGALLEQGYDVIPVHPRGGQVHGRQVYPDLQAIPRRVDLVDVFRRADQTPEVARAAVAIGAHVLWLQLGIVNEESARIARSAGLLVVMDRCTIVEHRRLIGRPFPGAAPSPLSDRAGEPDSAPSARDASTADRVGLCFDCRHARTVATPRSTFWLCRRSVIDPSFPRYPALPVRACRGYEPGEREAEV